MTAAEQVKWVVSGPAVREHPGPWPTRPVEVVDVSDATPHPSSCQCHACFDAEHDAYEQECLRQVRMHIAQALRAVSILADNRTYRSDPVRFIREYVRTQAKDIAVEYGLVPPCDPRSLISRELRQQIYEHDFYRCVECGSGAKLTLDHIIPLSKGGTNDRENLRTLCMPCNRSKGAR